MLPKPAELEVQPAVDRGPALWPPIVVGGLICALTVASFGAFATVAEIKGAVVAPGVVIVEGRTKKVQHQEGGIVAKILVDDGAVVASGDTLLRLDDTQTRVRLSIVNKQHAQQQFRLSRLKAERDKLSEPSFPVAKTDDERDAMATERAQFVARRDATTSQREQLALRISEKEQEIAGFSADIAAIDEQLAIARKEHTGLNTLYEQKHVPITRVLQLEREIAGLKGKRAQQVSNVARAREQIIETRLQLINVDTEFLRDVLAALSSTDAKLAELVERQTSAEDFLTRVDIKAPLSGVVHDVAVHTIGGVIRPGETLMVIVPRNDRLVVEARASPQDVDQLAVGQSAVVRFQNFNRLTTPELLGRVTRVSADVATDASSPQTSLRGLAASNYASNPLAAAQPYYAVRIEISDEALTKLDGARLVPGMQVETFIATSDRTVMSYLLKPIEDRLTRVMRER